MPGTPELEFPTNKAGEFVSQEDLQKNDLEIQKQEDEKMIAEISADTKAMPHLIKKNDQGEWTVDGISPEDYKKLWEGNDNAELYKRP